MASAKSLAGRDLSPLPLIPTEDAHLLDEDTVHRRIDVQALFDAAGSRTAASLAPIDSAEQRTPSSTPAGSGQGVERNESMGPDSRWLLWLIGGAIAIAASAFAAGFAAAATWSRARPACTSHSASAPEAPRHHGALAGSASAEELEPSTANAFAPGQAEVEGSVDQALRVFLAAQREEARALAEQVEALSGQPPNKLAEQAAALRSIVGRVTGSAPAMEALARLRTPLALDLLYAVRGASVRDAPPARMAEALLESKEVRGAASPALRLLLTVDRDRPPCEMVLRLLPEVAEQADERIVPVLARLSQMRACGRDGRRFCYQCLRTAPATRRAMLKAARREHPLR